jgi:acetyl-CoA C-acetyltransferase
MDPRTPVIVGAGQALDRPARGRQPREPVALIVDALREAGKDSGTGQRLLVGADSVRCVPTIGWHYGDLGAMVAADLGAHPRQTVQSGLVGGDGPQRLINDTARAIATGELDVALLGGGEAGASLRAAQLQGTPLPWRRQDPDARPSRTLDPEREPLNEAEAGAGLAAPVCMYALIESAVRARQASPPDVHLLSIASLWSRFSSVAASNGHAWIKRSYSAAEIATPAPDNRLVCNPYTKLLTANVQVNMATGLILTSAQAARDAGVPKDRWVFIHAGAQAQDEWYVSERRELSASPAIRALGESARHHCGRAVDEIAYIDLYSCFPSAVQVAARELGLPISDPARQLTVTGGLTFAGGPGNNYTSHAVATLVGLLRADPDCWALTTAVGWYLTKHALGIYSGRPPRTPFASLDPRPQPPPARRALPGSAYCGRATLEAYTLAYDRQGRPEAAIVSALTPADERLLVSNSGAQVIAELLADDPLGAELIIDGQDGLSWRRP